MLTARNGKLEVICYLTEIGADINIRNANNTPFHLAAPLSRVQIIKVFLY